MHLSSILLPIILGCNMQIVASSASNTLRPYSSKLKESTVPSTVSRGGSTVPRSRWAAVKCFPKENPFVFQLLLATCRSAGADFMTQVVAQGTPFSEVDWRQNLIFVVFGFAYLGCFQWFLMIDVYAKWFPSMKRFAQLSPTDKLKDKEGIMDAVKMVLFDIFVHIPLIYFPSFYTVKEFVVGTSLNPVDWAKNGATKYINNVGEDLTAVWQVWIPSDCIQFILPLHMRMPFRHFVGFFWTAYLSLSRGASK